MSKDSRGAAKRHIVTFDVDALTYAALHEIADTYDIHASVLLRAAIRREVRNVKANGTRAIERALLAGKAARTVGRPVEIQVAKAAHFEGAAA